MRPSPGKLRGLRRPFALLGIALLPLALAACEPASNENASTVVLDLVNEPVNVNGVGSASANLPVSNVNTTANANTSASVKATSPSNANTAAVSVALTAIGYTPPSVTVKVGQVVTWTNTSGSSATVSSDPHPTHTDLPELDSPTLGNGDTYSFTFTKVGTWGYHNHLDPSVEGTVIVQ